MKDLKPIISQFDITGTVNEVKPLGNGLINDTYKVTTVEDDAPEPFSTLDLRATTAYLVG